MTPVCLPANPGEPAQAPGGWFSTRAQIVAITCACAGASAFLYAVDPNRHAVYPQCLLYRATGFYCAGCGATRALHALFHGRVLEALHDNALLIMGLPVLFYFAGSYLLSAWQIRAWPQVMVENRTLTRRGIAVLLLLLGFMAMRNLPGWPFDQLKPLTL
ncbi:MAG: DUF2752 domain-containing protein [Methylacidiphilales bacterium]|nr:DUF2752 domain-containing protein [Candidatus Methylacidiphilales bacterium]